MNSPYCNRPSRVEEHISSDCGAPAETDNVMQSLAGRPAPGDGYHKTYSQSRRKSALFVTVMAAVALLFGSCHGGDSFRVKGCIEGADDAPVTVEKADAAGRWIAIDSARTDASGKFSIDVAAPASPEIYRLSSQGRYIYFSIDSLETIEVNTTSRDFGVRYTLAGSPNAVQMARFDSAFNALPANVQADALDAFKRTVYTQYLAPAKGNIVSYYILTKSFGDRPLYDPQNTADAKYYAAVATAYEQFRPNDPHTAMLKQISLDALRNVNRSKGRKGVLRAQELKVIEIDLPDVNGRNVRLSSRVGHGKPVVVVFTSMTSEHSPAYNAALKKLYDAGRADIYMVSLDSDRYAWREAARNLPWTNVFDPQGMRSELMSKYNVTTLPVCFVYNAAGELVNRADMPDQLSSML